MTISSFIWLAVPGLVFLLASSAAFSGAEVALFSLSKIQVRRLRQQHPVRGQLIGDLLDHPHRLLTTILLGNVIVNTAAAVLGYELIRHLGTRQAEIIAVPVMTLILLVICDVAPKSLTIQRAERFALWFARPLQFVVTVTGWPRRAAEIFSARLLQLLERLPYFAARRARSGTLTEGEYRTLLGVSERAGVLQREERLMVNRILELEDLQVREVMTPRVDIQFVEDNLTPHQVVTALRRYKHRRVPVFHDSRDNIVGILNVKEFLVSPTRPLAELMDQAQMVPETMSVARLLRAFRHQEHPLAIAVDEHGGTAGLVTLEDVLEEIVGEIEDEFDSSEIMVQRLGDGRYVINGKARLELVNEQCGLALEAEDVDTIAGWLISQLDSLPREGQSVNTPTVRATARKVVHHRVREVLLELNQP